MSHPHRWLVSGGRAAAAPGVTFSPVAVNLGVSHLRCLVAVADHHSFTDAAAELGLVQSSLSRSIAEAERRLRVTLFERTTRRVEVTPDGAAIVDAARRVLTSFDDGLAEIESFLSGDRGTIRIACHVSVAAIFLPPLIASFRTTYPQVRFQIVDGFKDEIHSLVRSGAVDLAIVSTTGPIDGLVQERIGLDPFFCIVPAGHRFAERDEIGWTELAGEPFVAFGSDSSLGAEVGRALESAEVTTGPVVRARNIEAVAGLVAAGLGVAAVTRLALPLTAFAGLVARPLVPAVHRRITLLQLADRRPTSSTRAFLDVIRSASLDGLGAPAGRSGGSAVTG
jgi:LysR family carnitine catabolism transcriptional activator